MGKIFGTDGVRGQANLELTAELAFKLGRAAAFVLKPEEGCKREIIIGRDTRISGSMLENALAAGICSAGVDVVKVGIVPTPGIAFLTRELKAMAGVVISASHNPVGDNGIKFFNSKGFKLPDEVEDEIEKIIFNGLKEVPYPVGKDVGKVQVCHNARELYLKFLKEKFKGDLKGIKIVVDCANGAASEFTPPLLRSLGAEVISIFDQPDGLNINENCGSTHIENLCETVVKEKADLGLAHDGDADRLLAVDHLGNVVDGDQILVICGMDLLRKKALRENRVVVTVMSNLGLKQAFEKNGVLVEETKVGDRYVLERMLETGAVLGGEQSGHVIFLDDNTTGDGILTALKLLEVVKNSGKPLAELALQMEKLPQVLENVRVKEKSGWEANSRIKAIIEEKKATLGKDGRILVRASGTEPLIRVMAEGKDLSLLEQVVHEIAKVIGEELN